MKAKELMVGDFVKLGKGILRCKNIIGHTNNVMLENGVITNVRNIKPSPLVRIHLTKNGFKAKDAEDITFVYRDGYQIEVLFEGGDFEPMILLSIKFADAEIWKQIDYVHELQQAMRIMGVDKEIVL